MKAHSITENRKQSWAAAQVVADNLEEVPEAQDMFRGKYLYFSKGQAALSSLFCVFKFAVGFWF